MTERSIILQGWEVRAALAGRKTQVRRVMKPQPLENFSEDCRTGVRTSYGWAWAKDWRMLYAPVTSRHVLSRCPFGVSGDRLWVRETWAQIWNQDGCLGEEGVCPCGGCHIEYKADTGAKYPGDWPADMGDDPDCPKWRPSVHMPRWASRLTLEVTNVRVERLQEISTADAIAEGMLNDGGGEYAIDGMTAAQVRFMDRWDTINQLRGYGWDKNPWAWVPDCKVVTP